MSDFDVVIPALNEQDTIADVVGAALGSQACNVFVIDSDSTDETAQRARIAGAQVINWREVLSDIPPRPGKGEALWRGVAAALSPVIVFVDADVRGLTSESVNSLAKPFADPSVDLVKANYQRTYLGYSTGGGRVTELCAKPLMRILFPHLAHIAQPLAGEYAVRRDFVRRVSFISGYGVEIGLLIDASHIVEVALPPRVHRNRPLEQVQGVAEDVAQAILAKAGLCEVDMRPPLNDYD
ncbi:glycosyltransferase [Corynebacterium sp. ES2794-CONJ1]|uniref:glycosyltransferase n=1 Tax=unclassified Corynebacterium TaxID=2624378 RepID=UPI002169B9D0|nr:MULTISPECIES: glycosyltransferase [unclassified Corynebacterium]MCS4489879.1 glycosyltransferase [Corynebacterium sp. ES2775-CONJ]MCS4491757.1 glycosyltransferase [Corynebacterium sp. ES2715-CONJ3]MCS4531862.1 glycosyltransferase [Corynebacterium sp. ES2730-CONJ]MCU9519259.1 glycosyltransferase [Corynebacterium sp. ES2794-CONJ1]